MTPLYMPNETYAPDWAEPGQLILESLFRLFLNSLDEGDVRKLFAQFSVPSRRAWKVRAESGPCCKLYFPTAHAAEGTIRAQRGRLQQNGVKGATPLGRAQPAKLTCSYMSSACSMPFAAEEVTLP